VLPNVKRIARDGSGDFPYDMQGVQDAIDSIKQDPSNDLAGGEVWIQNAWVADAIRTGGRAVDLPEGVVLRGFGSAIAPGMDAWTFVADADQAYIVGNAGQGGAGNAEGQHQVGCENVRVYGSKHDTQVGAGFLLRGVFVQSFLRHCVARECSGHGFWIDGGALKAPGSAWTKDATSPRVMLGPVMLDDIWGVANDEEQILVTGPANVQATALTAEFGQPDKALIRFESRLATGAPAQLGSHIGSIHVESKQATAVGVALNGAAVSIDRLYHGGSALHTLLHIEKPVGISRWHETDYGPDSVYVTGGVSVRNIAARPRGDGSPTLQYLVNDEVNHSRVSGHYLSDYTPHPHVP